jgi:hypothetical protein
MGLFRPVMGLLYLFTSPLKEGKFVLYLFGARYMGNIKYVG